MKKFIFTEADNQIVKLNPVSDRVCLSGCAMFSYSFSPDNKDVLLTINEYYFDTTSIPELIELLNVINAKLIKRKTNEV